jgi:hypothetical protein
MCNSVYYSLDNILFLLIRRLEEVEILQAEREAEPLAAGGTASQEKVKNLQVREMLLLVSNPEPYSA